MARTRYIKPATFLDEELADLPIEARYFFAGLWTQADREGRLEDRPKSLKAQILPWDKVDADRLLDLLAPKFIQRYSVEGRRYIWIVQFSKHQNPHKKEALSSIPAPEMGCPVTSGTSPGLSRPSPMGNGELGMGNTNGEGTGAKAPRTFKKPTVEEVRAYCQERGNKIDPQHFCDYNEGRGWVIGRSPMKDWQATVRTWEKNNFNAKGATVAATANGGAYAAIQTA